MNKKLLIRHINGELKEDSERSLVDEWINASQENKNYYNNLKALWFSYELNKSNVDDTKANIWSRIEHQVFDQDEKNKKIDRRFKLKKTLAIAASIIIIISLGVSILFYNKNKETDFYTFMADSGSKSKIQLIDGTTVYLNSETELLVPKDFGKNNRNVKLTGEAYFKVQKTKNKSLFTVEANNLNIKVLGTEFNVKSYPEEGTIETTLEKGKVEIEKRNGGVVKKIVTLEPNQRAIFIKKRGDIMLSDIDTSSLKIDINLDDKPVVENYQRKEKLVLQDPIKTKLYTSWKDGKLEFESERFEHLLVRFERWYGINIKVKTDSIKGVEYTGSFVNETLEQALDALKMTLPFNYKMDIENNIVYIE